MPVLRIGLTARCVTGAGALVFGLSHFVYAAFTAAMVPHWLPVPLLWSYATGAGHILAGLALIAGWRVRLTATALVTMCASFVLLLHVPRVAADPSSHAEWTMLVRRTVDHRRRLDDARGGETLQI